MKNALSQETLTVFNDLLASLRQNKQASVKSAVGETTHPVKDVDDGTVNADEGERSEENKSDVRENEGGLAVLGQEDANSVGTPSEDGASEGTQPQASDTVKGNVPDPKGTPKKPGSDGLGDSSAGHPSNDTFEEKYSSIRKLGEKVLAEIAVSKKAEAAPKVEKKAEVAPKADRKAEVLKDFVAGYKTAAALAQGVENQQVKQAEEEVVSTITKEAASHADAFCDYLDGFMAAQGGAQEKQAEHVKMSEEDKFKYGYHVGEYLRKEASAGTLTAQKVEVALAKLAEETGEVISPEALAGAMGAGGEVPPEMAGAGLPPEAAGAGLPPEGLAGEGAPEASDEEIQQLAEALAAEGVTAEDLIEAIQQAEGGAGAEGGEGLVEGAGEEVEEAPAVADESGVSEGEPVA